MDNKIRNYSFINGMFLGLILILIITSHYLYSSESILPLFNSCFYSSLIVLFLYSISALRYVQLSMIEYDFSFKLCFSIVFLILATALFFMSLYYYVLYNFIDKNLLNQYVTYQYDICLRSPDCDMSFELYFQFYQNKHFSFYGQIQQWIFSLIPCTLYSAIISLFMKK